MEDHAMTEQLPLEGKVVASAKYDGDFLIEFVDGTCLKIEIGGYEAEVDYGVYIRIPVPEPVAAAIKAVYWDGYDGKATLRVITALGGVSKDIDYIKDGHLYTKTPPEQIVAVCRHDRPMYVIWPTGEYEDMEAREREARRAKLQPAVRAFLESRGKL
jgi:hypothetical protein